MRRNLFVFLFLLILAGLPAPAAQADDPANLFFGLRITPELLDWFNQTAGPDDIATATPDQLGLLEQVTAGRKQLLIPSAAEAEKLIPEIADKIDIIGYDLEHWPATPADEQADPVAAIQRLRVLADEYDLMLALGPDRRFALDYGAQMAPFVDQFILQTQRLQSDANSLRSFAAPIIADLRQANPAIRVVVQIRTEGSVEELLELVKSLDLDVDGIGILHNPVTLEMAKSLAVELQGASAVTAVATTEPTTAATVPPAPTPLPGAPFWGVRMAPPLVDWFNQTAGPRDVATVIPEQIALLAQIMVGRKQVLFTSVDEAETLVPTMADKIDIIGYNPEHWAATPADEQDDLVTAVRRMRALADEYDLTFSLGPDRGFAQTFGAETVVYADQFALQSQRLQADAAQFQGFTDPLIQELRRANPDVQIVLQVRTEGDMADLYALIQSLTERVDGLAILYMPTTVDKMKELVTAVQTGMLDDGGEETAVTPFIPTPIAAQTAPPPTAAVQPTPSPTAAPLPTPASGSTLCLAPIGLVLAGGGLTVLFQRQSNVRRKKQGDANKETQSHIGVHTP